jgi:hypothetical protein
LEADEIKEPSIAGRLGRKPKSDRMALFSRPAIEGLSSDLPLN